MCTLPVYANIPSAAGLQDCARLVSVDTSLSTGDTRLCLCTFCLSQLKISVTVKASCFWGNSVCRNSCQHVLKMFEQHYRFVSVVTQATTAKEDAKVAGQCKNQKALAKVLSSERDKKTLMELPTGVGISIQSVLEGVCEVSWPASRHKTV